VPVTAVSTASFDALYTTRISGTRFIAASRYVSNSRPTVVRMRYPTDSTSMTKTITATKNPNGSRSPRMIGRSTIWEYR